MLKTIQSFFESHILTPASGHEERSLEHALQLATAALLIEVTRADFNVSPAERQAVDDAIGRVFGLEERETQEIVRLAEEEVDKSLSLYEFTRLVDRGFSAEQKKRIVEILWTVAFTDSRLETHEEYLIRKIAKLLHVRHEDFIDAKLKARGQA